MAPRLGELFVEAGILSPAQVDEALRVQVMWSGRLGTVLSELGYVDLDTLSRVLGWQHSLPAALSKHFDQADRELQLGFSPDLAEWHGCLPLLRAGKRVVVASIDPLNATAIGRVTRELGVPPDHLISSIAPELRLHYQLERVYSISRPHRLLRAPGTERSGAPRRQPKEIVNPHQDLLDSLFPSESTVVPLARTDAERRTDVTALGDGNTPQLERRPAEPAADAPVRRMMETYASAVHGIRCGVDRADIAAQSIDAIAQFLPAAGAAVLVVRGSVATTWTSFRAGRPPLTPIAVRLDKPGLAADVLTSGALARARMDALAATDQDLLAALGTGHGELVLVPIIVEDRVGALIAVAIAEAADVETSLREIADAAAAAFTRLVREVSQRTRIRILGGEDSSPYPRVE